MKTEGRKQANIGGVCTIVNSVTKANPSVCGDFGINLRLRERSPVMKMRMQTLARRVPAAERIKQKKPHRVRLLSLPPEGLEPTTN